MTTTCTMILGDCLEVMPTLASRSAAFCFLDLPYGTTDAKSWDVPIDLVSLWACLKECALRNAAFVFSATFKFAMTLALSNASMLRYDLIFHKESFGGHLNANKMPLRTHELLLVFYEQLPLYFPQKTKRDRLRKNNETPGRGSSLYGSKPALKSEGVAWKETGFRHPGSVLYFDREWGTRMHPTQKPVMLLDWLIRTYSNEGDMVLDPTAGSFTTCVAAASCGRSSVGIEKDEGYFEIGVERVRKHIRDNLLDVKLEVRK